MCVVESNRKETFQQRGRVKRGLITWDKAEIPPEIFDQRIARVRRVLAERELEALVVYSELWRSNQARFFSNYMPYFNRALLVIPREMPVTLFCGLSPRVYGWIRSVTTIEDVRPAGNFAKPLSEMAVERKWRKLGALDFPQFPYDLHKALSGGGVEVVNVESAAVFNPAKDETELAMRRKALEMAREILDAEMPGAVGMVDHHVVGRLERKFRRSGAEDLVVLLTNGDSVPAPAKGAVLEASYSISIAMEYRGHWIRVTRAHGITTPALRATFPVSGGEFLGGSYPFEWGEGTIELVQREERVNGKRLFYGETIL
jgi:hypothetical protein